MTERSLKATDQGIKQAKLALKQVRLNQTTLADRLEIARKTVSNFFTSKPVSDDIFFRICDVLKLDWSIVAGISEAVKSDLSESEIDTLVQPVRDAIRPLIQTHCGTMRVLDMEQKIELTGKNGIYTNVNILEKLTRLRSERDLQKDCDEIEWFDDRLGLGRSVKRLPGLDAVQKHRRLMVLGKPGAGKSTFLKYLAMQCIEGRFVSDVVPMFVTLKDFAEAPKSPSLVEYLAGLLPKVLTPETVGQLLESGRVLVLLDGLDEVREEDTQRVIREMRQTADRFGASQVVITCRIAAKEYTFERFTEVEVADFDVEQIATFAMNWFRSKDDLPKAANFIQRLKESKPIQELASSPLLLTLLCLVFGEGGDFPSNRADLYEEGVKILLKKWDAKRDIQRDEQYKKLDVQRREDLLSYVALQTFKQKEYFIKQRRMEGYIADFISNLRDVDPDPESLRINSEAVLKSIQAQHGLIVERARGIYSFSHLTFQEYFAAREIAATNQIVVLVPQMGEKRWREVFLLTVGMLRNADELLLAMKTQTDLILAQDEMLQRFLNWTDEKSSSDQVTYRLPAVRAFYYARALDLDLNLAHALDRNLAHALDLDRDLAHALDRDRALDLDLDLDYALTRINAHALTRINAHALDLDYALTRISAHAHARALAHDLVHAHARDPEMKLVLQG